MGIFQKRTRTNSYRTLRCLKESEEVCYQRIRQLSLEEVRQNLIIAGIAQCNRIKIVALHELIKNIRTKYHSLRNLHGCILILIKLRMTLDDIIKEGKTSTLSPQGAIANTGKVGILVKFHSIEDRNDT